MGAIDQGMKPPHVCPECLQEFTRKWNMREHCRSQHGSDPYSDTGASKPLHFLEIRKRPTLSWASPSAKKFILAVTDFLRVRRMGSNSEKIDRLPKDKISVGGLMDYFVDRCVIVSKDDIAGISGHICGNCQSFEFQYIQHIGTDLTAEECHFCPNNPISLGNKKMIHTKSVDCLLNITRSVLGEKVNLAVHSMFRKEVLHNFHAPQINLDSITPAHWAWQAILAKKIPLTDVDLKKFIGRMLGTYALVTIASGRAVGYHLFYLVRGE
jgi:hypothetical protein